ncbi:beta-mannosidase [Sphingomonas sp. Leaf231]|uniref:beta-mannosidase n=1 Tax=Sphingomonas sp. Leaf231 TaxID=1736301 RepID=UPI0006FD87C9|nr:glycoside hydrolase family 2 protein [Sphingomonas sp. Leaf231]KQN94114.1 beta-mannosidase [Sphingomonas sp. Leaf231]
MRARWLAIPLLLASTAAVAAPKTVTTLDDGWQVRIDPADAPAAKAHPRAAKWFRATVPGSVQQALIATKQVPDPFKGTNEAAIQWAGLTGWQYRRTLKLTPEQLARDHLDLVFDALDTFATIAVNGQAVLTTDNAHRTWRVDAKQHLKAGDNVIALTFASPIRKLQPMVLAEANPLPGEYDSAFGDEPKGKQTSPYIRKPKYDWSWDWGPRIVNIGPTQPMRLEAWDDARLAAMRVEQVALNDAEARLDARFDVVADRAGPAVLRATITAPDGKLVTAEQTVTLAPGDNRVTILLTIARPQRWQPVGYGAQPLYRVAGALVENGAESDHADRRIGLRTVELIHGNGAFGFKVNGTAIFAKGANLIPFDSFPARVTAGKMRGLLADAKAANMNMIRIWGGGYYLPDAFFDAADELGLMIWSDFMFGGAVTPPDAAFRENVRIEAEQQVARVSGHPSIVLWAGGNEVLSGWENWSDRKAFKKRVGADEQERIGAGMAVLFDRVLRQAVRDFDPGVPYWPGSPSTDYEGPVDTDAAGDRHFWDVWSGSKPVANYLNSCPRFMSEYGFQAMPDLATIKDFAGTLNVAPTDPVMKAHQKFLAGEGNDRLLHYIRERLGEPKGLADYAYLTQVNQAQAIEMAALHHRACRPVTMGSLYWQLNDVWPAISWSSIDYEGRWKLLHHAARRFFADQVIVAEHKDAATRIALVSDATTPVAAVWRVRALRTDGRVVDERNAAVTLAPLSATEVATIPDEELFGLTDARDSVVLAELSIGDRLVDRRIVERVLPKDVRWPDPGLTARWNGRDVTITATALARAVMLDFGATPAQPADDGFDLLPGESRTIAVASDATPAQLKRALTLRSLGGRK